MDTDQLVEHGRARFEHASARRLLKEQYQAKMVFVHEGGMWHAGPELLCILSVCETEQAVLLDLYEQPVRVNVKTLRDLTYQRWQEQLTAWLLAYQDISTKR